MHFTSITLLITVKPYVYCNIILLNPLRHSCCHTQY